MVHLKLLLSLLIFQVLTERCVSKGVFLKNVFKVLKPINFVAGVDESEENDWEEIQIEDDAVFSCVKCDGKFCWDAFVNFEIRTEIASCNPGEICWKGITPNGTFRGCATRECLPVKGQFNTTKIKDVAFNENFCCVKDECNSAGSLLGSIGLAFGSIFLSLLLREI